jgi:hypothetical protein
MTKSMKEILSNIERNWSTERPPSLFSVKEKAFRKRYQAEFDQLEAFDWSHGTPDQLRKVYEPNTHLSTEGYKWLLPRVFQFCIKWREDARRTDFVYVYFQLPQIRISKGMFSMFSGAEKSMLWDVIEFVHQELDFDILDSSELIEVKEALI